MKRLICSIAALAVLGACTGGAPESVESPGMVSLRFEKDYVDGATRSSVIPEGVELVESGGTVAFYNAATGRLDSQFRVDDLSGDFGVSLPAGRMNIYAICNLWLVDGAGNAVEPEFPVLESDVPLMEYRIGGADAGGGLRTETYSEIGTWGIPARGSMKDVEIAPGAVVTLPLQRMFAKVRITVDHSGMSADEGMFRNGKLYFRQANARQTVFAEGGSRALAEGDAMVQSDYESPMEDGALMSSVFYIPENRMLTPDDDLSTYVEFSAEVDRAAGGFGGGVTYRFYLGKRSGVDRDVEANTFYDVLLTFNVGSLFNPCWRVDPEDDFSDDRLFCVMKDEECQQTLGTQKVAVRSGRPGKVYVYMNRQGLAGSNDLIGKVMTDNWEASSLEDCAWGADFSGLSQYGITASWAPSLGRLTLSVSQPDKFVTGVDIPVTLVLQPGGREVVMNVLTVEDQEVELSSDDLYMGMKRSVTLKGFVGSAPAVNVFWPSHSEVFKLSADASDPFIGEEPVSLGGDSAELYAWGAPDRSVMLEFSSDDSFNDDLLQASLPVWKPSLRNSGGTLKLLLDGTAVPLGYGFDDRNGTALDRNAFDDALYTQLLGPSVSFTSASGEKYAGCDGDSFYIDYLGEKGGSDWIGDLINAGGVPNSAVDCLGGAVVRPLSPLLTESAEYDFEVYFPYYKTDFPETFNSNYLNEYCDSELGLEAEMYTFGNSGISFSGESSSGGIQLKFRTAAVDSDLKSVEVYMGTDVNLLEIPGGLNSICCRLENPRVQSGDGGIDWQSYVSIYHDLTIAPFGVFRSGSPILAVYLTYAKAAWMMKKYLEGTSTINPSWTSSGEMDEYDKYLNFSRKKTTAKNKQSTTSLAGDKVTVMYCDMFPAEYPVQSPFTQAKAEEAAAKTWLTDVCFKSGGYKLAQPLTSTYLSGNVYYRIVSSTTPHGWVYVSN